MWGLDLLLNELFDCCMKYENKNKKCVEYDEYDEYDELDTFEDLINIEKKDSKKENTKEDTKDENKENHTEIVEIYKGFTITSTPVEVEVVDVLGSDLTVVNAARISFGVESKELKDKDKKLINYLAKNKHYSPFRHCMIQFRIKSPEFVMRQAYKHVVGAEWCSMYPTKDHAWNEISGRYKQYKEIYMPQKWFGQNKVSKQCSSGPLENQDKVNDLYLNALKSNLDAYENMINQGVSKEQSRMLLPLTFITEVVWTASLQAIHNFVLLRNSEHAQYEIKLLAQQIQYVVVEKFPVAFDALVKYSN